MQNWWATWQLGKIKQKEILKQAELQRLLKESGPNRREAASRFRAIVSNLGTLLVCWGLYLQSRYGVTATKNSTQTS